jgi:hypothetical protein
MKCLSIFVILSCFLLTSQNKTLSSTFGPAGNKWYQLVMGVFHSLTDGSSAGVQQCLPQSWRSQDTKEEADNASCQVQSKPSTLVRVLSVVSKVIKVVCKFKNLTKKLLRRKLRRRMKFVQRRFWRRFRHWTRRAFNKAKIVFNRVGKSIKRTIRKGLSLGKRLLRLVVKALMKIWGFFTSKIRKIFNSRIVQTVLKVFECVRDAKDSVVEIIQIVKGIIKKVHMVTATAGTGAVVVLVDMICNWDEFRRAIQYLIRSIKEKKILTKWNWIGRTIGQFFRAISTA